MELTNWHLWIETKETGLETASEGHSSASGAQSISAQQKRVTPTFAEGVKAQNE